MHPKTAYRWFREGILPVPARRAGRLILVDADPKPAVVGKVAAYCRVSSADQKDDLERRGLACRWARWCPRSGRV